jgi:hypothetical protein
MDHADDGPVAHLADGWEAGLERDTVLRAGFEAWVADAVHLARSRGGRVDDQGDVVLVDAGFPSFFLTCAFLRGPVPAARIAEIPPWYEGPFGVVSPVPTPDLGELGLTRVGHPPFMVRPAGGEAPAPTLAVEEVTDAEAMAEWERCLVEAFPLPGAERWSPGAAFDGRVLGGDARFWVGREPPHEEGGRPGDVVACSSAHVHGGVVLVSYVASRVRRRGHGETITWAATAADPSLPAVLIASDDGRRIYERMGYLPVTRVTLWAGGA